MCLYSDDSTLPRSLLAASQSVSSNDFSFFFAAGFLAMFLFAMRNLVGKFYRNMQHTPSVLPSRCTLLVVVNENQPCFRGEAP